jgi:hypothetical protein
MVVTREAKDSLAFQIERHVKVIAKLVKEMAGVRPLIAAPAVIGAPQIGASTDTLIRPAVPHAVRV